MVPMHPHFTLRPLSRPLLCIGKKKIPFFLKTSLFLKISLFLKTPPTLPTPLSPLILLGFARFLKIYYFLYFFLEVKMWCSAPTFHTQAAMRPLLRIFLKTYFFFLKHTPLFLLVTSLFFFPTFPTSSLPLNHL